MFNLGLPEMIVLGVVALLVFGPRRLPELAKGLGKGLRDFKKAVSGEFDDGANPKQIAEPPPSIAAHQNDDEHEHEHDRKVEPIRKPAKKSAAAKKRRRA